MTETADRRFSVSFRSSFMGTFYYDLYDRSAQESYQIDVRYLEPTDYERSISTDPAAIPTVGSVYFPPDYDGPTVARIAPDIFEALRIESDALNTYAFQLYPRRIVAAPGQLALFGQDPGAEKHE